jgi:uncharacterized membrane protein
MNALPESLRAMLRSLAYAVRGGFLVRPFAIALALGVLGMAASRLEEMFPAVSGALPGLMFPSGLDPAIAQTLLTDIATSIMTVVSIVFAILLMTLTLASTQFSPRILVSFVRDRVTQWTLGVFLGTFSYCMAALPTVRTAPPVFVPVVTTMGALALAPVCVGWLIFFIHHISNAVSVNEIIDRIRRETESVIDEVMPAPRQREYSIQPPPAPDEAPTEVVASRMSGYLRFVDIPQLRTRARAFGVRVRLERRIGHFIPEGVAILKVSPKGHLNEASVGQLLETIDIGPTRTMQQDIEFGVVQIVDIALRALSPAVNDPTTAISCVDQLSCILIRWAGRAPPASDYFAPPNVLRLSVPRIGFDGLLDLAFEQIRHYAAADAAVSLRLMRALGDIASAASDPELRRELVARGERVVAGCTGRLQADDLRRLERRLGLLKAGLAEEE